MPRSRHRKSRKEHKDALKRFYARWIDTIQTGHEAQLRLFSHQFNFDEITRKAIADEVSRINQEA